MSVDAGGNPQQFKCPQCKGDMAWDASVAALRCPYCRHTMAPPQTASTPGVANVPPPNGGAPLPGAGPAFPGAMGAGPREIPLSEGLSRAPKGLGTPMRTFACRDCGATVNVGPNEQTAQCTYCASTTVMAVEPNPNLITPESLVPFLVPREKASESFKTWLAGLWFRPNNLKTMARLEQIAGVYVPFWTFDAQVESQWTAERGHYYYTEETYTEVENGQTVTRTRQVRHTRWEPASGFRRDHFDDVLVCGSKGLPESLVDRFSTFDTRHLVHYQPGYLAGWRAESYAIDLPQAWPMAQRKIERQQESRCRGDVGGDEVRSLNVYNRYSSETFKHVLLPVYVAAYRYQDKPYRFLVNGQTGEVVGESPLSWVKITLLVLFILAVIAVIYFVTRDHESTAWLLPPATRALAVLDA